MHGLVKRLNEKSTRMQATNSHQKISISSHVRHANSTAEWIGSFTIFENVKKLERGRGRSLVRVRSWVQRGIHNCLAKRAYTIGELANDELHESENRIFQEAEIEEYPEEIKVLKEEKS